MGGRALRRQPRGMLQYAVSRLLGSYLAEYVQRVDGKSLDLALWKGDV